MEESTTPPADVPTPRRMHHFFEATCRSSGERTALVVGDRSLSYAELDVLANRMAGWLHGLGLRPGDRCGIRLSRSLSLYLSMLAVLKAGAAFVPIEPACPEERLRFILDDSDVTVLVTTSTLAPAEPVPACRVVEVDDLEALLSGLPEEARDSSSIGDDDGDAACYVMYTSGYTGRPKGVEISHGNVCSFLQVIPEVYGIRRNDRVYQGMTLAFDFALEEIWPAWCSGATVVAGPMDAGTTGPALGDFIADMDVTVLCSVPTVLAMIERELPSVRTLIIGGEVCPDELVSRWVRPGRRILNTYGPTETTITATCSDVSGGGRVTIGRPVPGYSVHVLDDRLRPVPPGAVGEICISGPGVSPGYVSAPQLTAERFAGSGAERVYRTGDLGTVLATGELQFLGRADSQVQLRGHRVELQEIESVLTEDEGVRTAAAAVVPTVSGEPTLAAYVTVRRPQDNDDDLVGRLLERVRARLSPYIVPEFLDVVPRLPSLPNGKVDRSSLPRPRRRFARRDIGYSPPDSALEVRMTAVWAKVLAVPMNQVSTEADFFLDLGGHSWLAAALISALRRSGVARTLSVSDLYAFPTVRQLARRHQDLARALVASLPAQRLDGQVPGLTR